MCPPGHIFLADTISSDTGPFFSGKIGPGPKFSAKQNFRDSTLGFKFSLSSPSPGLLGENNGRGSIIIVILRVFT